MMTMVMMITKNYYGKSRRALPHCSKDCDSYDDNKN